MAAKIAGFQTLLTSKYGLNVAEIIDFRRELHQHPEIAFEEHATKERLIRYLVKHGIPETSIKHYAKTGFTCDITGLAPAKGSTKVIGLRSELDALPMKELNTVAYASKTEAAHTCGHDGHMATLLATAEVLWRHRSQMPANKTVRLLFQPAEEIGKGAEMMVKEGALRGVDEVYALHCGMLPLGTYVIKKEGAMSTGLVRFNIEIQGKGSHGAYPEKGHDPITAICQTHGAIHTILSRGISAKELLICTIGKLHAGSAENVIPDSASMGGTIRYEKVQVLEEVKSQLARIVEQIPAAFGCTGTLKYTESTLALMNAKEPAAALRKAVSFYFGEEALSEDTAPISEDFAAMAATVPGAYMGVGSVPHGTKAINNHNPYFNFNDDTIASSVLIWLRLIEDRLEFSLG